MKEDKNIDKKSMSFHDKTQQIKYRRNVPPHKKRLSTTSPQLTSDSMVKSRKLFLQG
jgi:hypothetical protein